MIKQSQKSKSRGPRVLEGIFRVHPRGYSYVIPDGQNAGGEPIRISKRATGEAMPGDRVRISKSPRGKRRGKMVYAGKVLDVLERASKTIVGTLRQSDGGVFLFPDGKRQQSPILIRFDKGERPKGNTKAVVNLVEYPKAGHSAVAEVAEILGEGGDPGAEILSVMRRRGLSEEFSSSAIEQATDASNEFTAQIGKGIDFEGRENISDSTVITIDPVDARDFDDAIGVLPGPGGNITLAVHIADVSHFVKEDSNLDLEARAKSTSIYFPGRVVPMLPDVLSGGVCSLKEGEPRLAKSVYITYDKKGRVLNTRFKESVIVSSKRLTYEQASKILDGNLKGYQREVVDSLLALEKLARAIEKRRIEEGMLHLNLKEVDLVLDDSGKVVDAAPKESLYSHKMVEMFMVEANEAVAELLEELEVPFLSRVHADPDEESQMALQASLKALGHSVSKEPDRRELQTLIDSVSGEPEEYAVNMAILRSFKQAEYSATPAGHFALASEYYCHFTSPIRRYPDLVVHRLFEKHCRGTLKAGQKKLEKKMSDLGIHCSEKERDASEAEYEVRGVLVLLYLKKLVGHVFDGVITGASDNGLFIQISKFLAEGMIRFPNLGDDWWELVPKSGVVRGQQSGTTYRIGQVLKVRIESVDVARRHLNLAIAE